MNVTMHTSTRRQLVTAVNMHQMTRVDCTGVTDGHSRAARRRLLDSCERCERPDTDRKTRTKELSRLVLIRYVRHVATNGKGNLNRKHASSH